MARPDGNIVREYNVLDAYYPIHSTPIWSPDGKHILFWDNTVMGSIYTLRKVNVDKGEQQALLETKNHTKKGRQKSWPTSTETE